MIYLDYNATTPVHPSVLDSMIPYFSEKFANSSSRTHESGREAEKTVIKCRENLGNILQIEPQYIVFTSGATEANNLVLFGLKKYFQETGKKKIITSEFEHKSILDPIDYLNKEEGFQIIYIKPKKNGRVSPDDFEKHLDESTALLTLMHVNNELGTLQPIKEVARMAKKYNVLVHVDGAQGFCKTPIRLEKDIDYYTASSHKIYGPKGIGCLFINGRKSRKHLRPIIFGGGHEGGVRSGTLPVPLIVGFDKASQICKKLYSNKNKKKFLSLLELAQKELKKSPSIVFNSNIDKEICNTLSFRVKNIKSEALLLRLKNIALSNGSACTSRDYRPSHVLKSIGLTEEECLSSIRLSIGHQTTESEIIEASKSIHDMLEV